MNLEEGSGHIFTGLCKEDKHNKELEFFCKTHNQLCCAVCLCKIKKKKIGKHKDCDVCIIEDIKDEKINKLKENIKCLEELSSTFEESFNNLKKIFEQINNNKEELKIKIQKIFTRIRNELNNREDIILLEVDKQFSNFYFKEELLKESEKLPNKIKISLENGKKINNEFNDKQLILLINDCINIENNIKEINVVNENIKKCKNSDDLKIRFFPEEEKEINKFLNIIKSFGKVENDNKQLLNLSSIINNDRDKQNSIINWIKEKYNEKSIKFELIFKMSEMGTKSKYFHKYCDNKGPSLILIKTKNNKIFGGFTHLNWNIKDGNTKDLNNNTFIFSLNLKKKYDMINKEGVAIINSPEYGPNFGQTDFALTKDMTKGKSYADSSSNFLSTDNLELTGERGTLGNFETEEFEVYKVIFNN